MTNAQIQRVKFHTALTDVRFAEERLPSQRIAKTPEQKPPDSTAESRPPTVSPEQIEQLLSKIAKTVTSFTTAHEMQSQEVAREAVSLGMTIARHILGRSVEAGEFNIQPLLENAAARLAGNSSIAIRLHPQDLANLRESCDGVERLEEQVEFIPDPQLASGSCVAISGSRQLVSTIEQRLDDAERLLMKGLDDARS